MGSFIGHSQINRLRNRVLEELFLMGRFLDKSLQSYPFKEILSFAESNLSEIADLFAANEINPHVGIRTSRYDSKQKVTEEVVRIGFYPLAADPLHWAHLLIGLSAMSKCKLDKVIYAIAGSDPRKPHMTPETIRYPMGIEVLKIFAPLFGYSSIAVGDDKDGEANLFNFLQLNPKQKIHAFYIAGADHCRRISSETSRPDTIQKLEDNISEKSYGFEESLHRVGAIFVERGKREHKVETFLPVSLLPALPFEVSSTKIRDSFKKKEEREILALLPYTAYQWIERLGLYSSQSLSAFPLSLPLPVFSPV